MALLAPPPGYTYGVNSSILHQYLNLNVNDLFSVTGFHVL